MTAAGTYAAFVRYTRDAGVLFADIGTAAFSGRADLVDGLHPSQPYSERLTARLAAAVGIAYPIATPTAT